GSEWRPKPRKWRPRCTASLQKARWCASRPIPTDAGLNGARRFLPAVREWRPHARANKILKPHPFDKRTKKAPHTHLGSLTCAFGRQELPLPMVLAWLVWRRPCSPSRYFLDGDPAGSLSPNSRPRLSPSEVRQRSLRKPRSIGLH